MINNNKWIKTTRWLICADPVHRQGSARCRQEHAITCWGRRHLFHHNSASWPQPVPRLEPPFVGQLRVPRWQWVWIIFRRTSTELIPGSNHAKTQFHRTIHLNFFPEISVSFTRSGELLGPWNVTYCRQFARIISLSSKFVHRRTKNKLQYSTSSTPVPRWESKLIRAAGKLQEPWCSQMATLPKK